VLAAAADEVSAAVAAMLSEHGLAYQALSAQAAAFHTQFVQALGDAAGTYAAAEVANATRLVLGVINAPTELVLGRPLIGNGADGTARAQVAGLVGCCTATVALAIPRRTRG